MPSAEPSSTGWLVAVPTGTEGPYSLDELRRLLRAGRLRPDDHLMTTDASRTCLLSDVISDARELSDGSERVRRRSTSDRHRAAGTSSEVCRLRTPLPGLRPEPVARAITVDAPPPVSLRRRILLAALGTLLLAFTIVILVVRPWKTADPGLQPYRTWQLQRIGDRQGPWRLEIGEHGVTITGPEGTWTDRTATVRSVDLHRVEVSMSTAHAALGSQFTLIGSGNTVSVTSFCGSGEAGPSP